MCSSRESVCELARFFDDNFTCAFKHRQLHKNDINLFPSALSRTMRDQQFLLKILSTLTRYPHGVLKSNDSTNVQSCIFTCCFVQEYFVIILKARNLFHKINAMESLISIIFSVCSKNFDRNNKRCLLIFNYFTRKRRKL
jgi:hypothetical protein